MRSSSILGRASALLFFYFREVTISHIDTNTIKKTSVKLEILENGDSFINLTEEIIEEFQLKGNNKSEFIFQIDGAILDVPLMHKYKHDNLLRGINGDNIHDEIGFAEPCGNEE